MAGMESLRSYELWTPARDHITVAAHRIVRTR